MSWRLPGSARSCTQTVWAARESGSRAVGEGTLLLDVLTKRYIREVLSYRFATVLDSASAFRVERLVQAGTLDAGKPILNPR
jgi:hypothetical protein